MSKTDESLTMISTKEMKYWHPLLLSTGMFRYRLSILVLLVHERVSPGIGFAKLGSPMTFSFSGNVNCLFGQDGGPHFLWLPSSIKIKSTQMVFEREVS